MLPLKVKDHLASVYAAMAGCEADIDALAEMISQVRKRHGRIWILGNGGSLAIGQHFAQDLLKLCNVRAHSINCPSILTAYGNDDGFEYSFFNPIRKLSEIEDPVIIFSCSGKSRNYIEFVSGFPEVNNPIYSVVGTDGGFLKGKSKGSVHIKSNDYQICETAFCVVADLVVKSLMEEG